MIAPIDNVARAKDAWGDELPNWVLKMAEDCNRTSQSKVGRRLGVSASLVSQTISRKYPGDMTRIRELAQGEYERATVPCPVLGEIAPLACRRWQAKAERLRTGNNQNARMFRACRICPHCKKNEEQ